MKADQQRRLFLKTAIASSTIGLAISAGLLAPAVVLAQWNENAFKADKASAALNNLYGDTAIQDSDKVTVKVPDVAENGAVVPVSISSTLENVEMISLLVAANSRPLAATFEMQPVVDSDISIRAKVGKTSDIIAVVKSNGKLYTGKKSVKVTKGGCG